MILDIVAQKNRTKMLQPPDLAEKIAEMIFDTKTYKKGDSIQMYSNDIWVNCDDR